jgi:16S rRNA (guanine527-N7)-methyltransferase
MSPPLQPARIAQLLTPFLAPSSQPGEPSAVLSSAQLGQISTYIDLLLRWNARINLTAIRTPEEIVTRHFGESFFAAIHLLPKIDPATSSAPPVSSVFASVTSVVKDFDSPNAPSRTLRQGSSLRAADLGSGAGFPGIPLKLWAPEIHMTLIESNQKKSFFLRETVRSLNLDNIEIASVRAESLPHAYDLVTLRAVERFSQALPTAARLTRPAGRLALLIASSQMEEAHTALPEFSWQNAIAIPNSESRILLVCRRDESRK